MALPSADRARINAPPAKLVKVGLNSLGLCVGIWLRVGNLLKLPLLGIV